MASFFSHDVTDITYKLLADFDAIALTGAITRYYGFWNDNNFYVALYFSTSAGNRNKDKLYLIMIPTFYIFHVRIKLF